MRKWKIILIIIIIFISIYIICYFNFEKNKIHVNNINDLSSIKEREYAQIGNNIYYEDYLIEEKGNNKKDVLNKYKIISDYINKNYPNKKIYISNFNYDTLDERIYINGYQIIDMIIIEDVFFTICIKNNKIEEFNFNRGNFINEIVEPKNLISVQNVKEKALNLAKENYDKIFDSNSSLNKICGEYYLNYDMENRLYYMVILNHGSYVKIDAMNGEIVDTFFFNGIYF